MPPDPGAPNLFEARHGVVPGGFERLTAFRYTSYDVPFWVRPNSREGRWNRRGDPPTQYWSLTPDAAWAELIRHEAIKSEEELEMVRMPFWACSVSVAGLLDLRDQANRSRHRVDRSDLKAPEWEACQAIADSLRDQYRGIITPSAALPGGVNLTLFGPRRAIAFDQTPKLASAVPAAQVAIGRPPRGLLDRIEPLSPKLF